MACASAVDQRADKKPAPNMNPKARERRMRFMRPSEGRQLKQLLTRASQNRSIPMGASSIPRFLKRYQGMKVGVCQRSIEPQEAQATLVVLDRVDSCLVFCQRHQRRKPS